MVGGDKKRPATKKKSDLGWIDRLEEIDAARRNGLIERDGIDAGLLRRAVEHLARHKADAEVALHHGQDLTRGRHLHIGGEGKTAA